MLSPNTNRAPPTGGEDFASLLDTYLGADTAFAGSIISGLVLRVEGDVAVVDVGLKSEGRVPLKEFAAAGETAELQAGDRIDIYVERYEDRDGSIRCRRNGCRKSWAASPAR